MRVIKLMLTILTLLCFSSNSVYSQMLFPKKIDQKWGYANNEGQLIVAAKFDHANEFDKAGYATAAKKGTGVKKDNKETRVDTVYLIDSTGKIVLSNPYRNFYEFSTYTASSSIAFVADGIYEVHKYKRESYTSFSDSIYLYAGGRKIISTKSYDSDFESMFQLASSNDSHNSGIVLYYCENATGPNGKISKKLIGINRYGKILFQIGNVLRNKNLKAGFFDGLSAFYSNQLVDGFGSYGFIDTTGKIVIQPKYHFVTDFSEGYALAGYYIDFRKEANGFQCFVIDKSGKETAVPALSIKPTINFYSSEVKNSLDYLMRNKSKFSKGMIKVLTKCINTKGEIVPCQ